MVQPGEHDVLRVTSIVLSNTTGVVVERQCITRTTRWTSCLLADSILSHRTYRYSRNYRDDQGERKEGWIQLNFLFQDIRSVCDKFAEQGLPNFPQGIAFTFWEQYLHLNGNLLQVNYSLSVYTSFSLGNRNHRNGCLRRHFALTLQSMGSIQCFDNCRCDDYWARWIPRLGRHQNEPCLGRNTHHSRWHRRRIHSPRCLGLLDITRHQETAHICSCWSCFRPCHSRSILYSTGHPYARFLWIRVSFAFVFLRIGRRCHSHSSLHLSFQVCCEVLLRRDVGVDRHWCHQRSDSSAGPSLHCRSPAGGSFCFHRFLAIELVQITPTDPSPTGDVRLSLPPPIRRRRRDLETDDEEDSPGILMRHA